MTDYRIIGVIANPADAKTGITVLSASVMLFELLEIFCMTIPFFTLHTALKVKEKCLYYVKFKLSIV